MRPHYAVWDRDEGPYIACADGWRPASARPVGRGVLRFTNAGHLAAFSHAQRRQGRSVRAVLVGHGPHLPPAPQPSDEPEAYYLTQFAGIVQS